MRTIGLVLSLGIIAWVLLQAAGGGDAETVIPESQEAALESAKDVEQQLNQAVQAKMQDIEPEH